MNHVAANKNLTASEQKTRRAIAILAGKIEAATPTPATTAISTTTAALRKEAENLVADTPCRPCCFPVSTHGGSQ